MTALLNAFVADLRSHYNTDYDTTVPGEEFDAELRRIIIRHTNRMFDTAPTTETQPIAADLRAARVINLRLPTSVLDQGIIETLGVSEAALQFEYELAEIISREMESERSARTLSICAEPAGHLIAGASWFACVLAKGHEGEHRRGGNCLAHGNYVGDQCPEWPTMRRES